jgi:hypothetical protein
MVERARSEVTGLTPILNVADFEASMKYFSETLGFARLWAYGTFGCVARDGAEIFLSEAQGTRGTWMSIFVSDVDALHDEIAPRGAKIVKPPTDMEHKMRECWVEDLDGNTFRFGHELVDRDLKITRATLEVRLESRLAAVLQDLASAGGSTVGELLEEIVLHSWERVPGREDAVWSPYPRGLFALIEELKRKHNLDYDTHGNHRFTEEQGGQQG